MIKRWRNQGGELHTHQGKWPDAMSEVRRIFDHKSRARKLEETKLDGKVDGVVALLVTKPYRALAVGIYTFPVSRVYSYSRGRFVVWSRKSSDITSQALYRSGDESPFRTFKHSSTLKMLFGPGFASSPSEPSGWQSHSSSSSIGTQ
jgi:hypothetical protein